MKNKFLLLLYFCSINCLNLIFAIESIRLPYTVSNYNIDLFDQDNTKARVILNLNFIESGEITIDVSNLSKKTMEIVSIKSKNINKNQSEIIILDCTLKKSGYQRFDLKINFIPNDESIKNLVNYSKIPIYIDTKEGKIINYSLNRPEKKYTMEPKIINRFPNIKKPIAIQFSQNNSSINNDENSSANKKSISRISTYNITIQISGAITYENVYGNILGVPNVAVWLDWDFDHNPSTTYLPYDPQGSLHVEKDITDMNGNYYFSFTFINSPYPANYYSDIIRVYANNSNDAAYDGDLGYGAKFTEYYYIDISQSSTSIYSNSADIEVFVDQGSALRYLFRARQFSINELDFTPHLLRYYYRYNEDISFFCEPGNCGGMDMGSPRIVFNSTPRSETAYHEYGHYIEYDKVGFLVGGGDDPHWFRKETNHIQAWKEGWAEFCSAATTMYWYSIELPSILEVNGVDIESPYPQVYQFLDYSQGQLFSNRDNHKVEGAIACFFYSLWDGVDRRAPNYIGDNDDISYAGSFILNNLANRYNQIGQLRGSTHIEAYKVAILSFLDNQNDASVNALYNALILRSGTAKPAQPTSITINGNYNSRTISWNDNTCPDEVWYTMEPDYPLHFNLVENNETGFKIYRKQTSDTWNGTLDGYTHVGTVGQDIVSWTDNDDLLGRYSYVVVAYNASGNSIPKAESKILINDFPQEISSTLTLDNADYYCDGTTISSGTLTIKPGARIFIKAGKDIIVKYNTNAKIIAIGNSGSSIKFLKQDGSAWGDIHLMTPGNTFKYCIFDGGTNNVQVHHNNNTFELCTFKNATNCGLYAGGLNYTTQYRSNFSVINCLMDHNKYGIYAYFTYANIKNCTISHNTLDGLVLNSAIIGRNDASKPYPGLFTDNLITANSRYGIYLSSLSDRLYFGYGGTPGHNRICNNASTEIYINNGFIYQSSSGATSDIYDGPNTGYYIFSLTQTQQGEYWVTYQQPAQYNYWSQATPPLLPQRFNNSVDYAHASPNDYGDAAGETGAPENKILNSPVIPIAFSINEEHSDNEIGEEEDFVKKRMEYLKNCITLRTDLRSSAAWLNEIYHLMVNEDMDDKYLNKSWILDVIDKKYKVWEVMNKFSNRNSPNPFSGLQDTIRTAYKLVGEVAFLCKLDWQIQSGEAQNVLDLIDANEEYITNGDNKRVLLDYKVYALELVGRYEDALAVIDVLEDITREGEIPGYIAPDYDVTRYHLYVNMERDGEQFKVAKLNTEESMEEKLPEKFTMSQNYPNPFNPTTTIPFQLPRASRVKIVIYNTLGRMVAELTDQDYQAGYHTLTFEGNGLASGIYFIRAQMQTKEKDKQNFVFNKKMILIK